MVDSITIVFASLIVASFASLMLGLIWRESDSSRPSWMDWSGAEQLSVYSVICLICSVGALVIKGAAYGL